ncbi:MAG: hypothetical protein I8H75_06355 [Myxococcaceae bacterium]|nr:hypothetical protein [Myxococcaceae bacterium]MBH2006937.1 hypothetical protein [Myxococcaceae bacterium]
MQRALTGHLERSLTLRLPCQPIYANEVGMPTLLFFALFMAFGCAHDKMVSVQPSKPIEVLSLSQIGQENHHLIGHFKLQATGLKRFWGSFEFDVVAQDPHYLYLAVDSFFRQPAQIVRYNGISPPGSSKHDLQKALNLPIEASELVDIFLRRIGTDLEWAEARRESGRIQIPLPNQQNLWIELEQNGSLRKRTLTKGKDHLVYSVTYTRYPFEFELEVSYQNQIHKAILSSHDAKLNQGPIDEQLFHR